MKKLFLFCGAIYLLGGISAVEGAETTACLTPPSCESLGFAKSADDCPFGFLKCPFDKEKVFCPNICEEKYIFNKTTKNCECKVPPSLGSNEFCMTIRDGKGNILTIGTFGAGDNVFNLCCDYKFSCAPGLVYNPSCKCCDIP